MMIGDEDPALCGGSYRAPTFLKPATHRDGRYLTTPPNIGASIERVAQNIADQALRRNLPDQPRSLDGVGRQLNVVISEPLECLTRTPQFSKLREHELKRFTDPSIGTKHNLTRGVAGISNREPFECIRFGSSGPEIEAGRRSSSHPLTAGCRRLSWTGCLESRCEAIGEARDRRACLLRYGCAEILISAHSGNSIQTGIFSRFPAGSMTQTAPSLRFGLRRICRVAP
jgi:hypothetical protein